MNDAWPGVGRETRRCRSPYADFLQRPPGLPAREVAGLPCPSSSLKILGGEVQHEHQRTLRYLLVVVMHPDPWPELLVQPVFAATAIGELAAQTEAKRTGTGREPVSATVQAQRVGARLEGVRNPGQLQILLAPDQAPIARPLPGVHRSGIEHPPCALDAADGLVGGRQPCRTRGRARATSPVQLTAAASSTPPPSMSIHPGPALLWTNLAITSIYFEGDDSSVIIKGRPSRLPRQCFQPAWMR